ncbi:twin-arginine translocase TatA/TatE family subunit [Nitratifractor salsuginis]|uniref:Sec-independent protein translocase protein TatA n=1 Tax=Nitratifractor salsuginis (strain DSM 16511 / JCM 12458 / E9I37-1) TaxID=749222 RepID=E6WZ01_NITSE|nr:twin-arginine translocase TatA/TatE family subunit [Nitratifractor salsuginis]ADV45451.1 twin-arginine translocation protein, TatA/E family subunit [Nitratifractor salsuginis DSM 16511]
MGMPSGWELLLVVGVIVLLFGGKKIPELAKGLGKGIKDFKQAVKEDEEASAPAKEIENKEASASGTQSEASEVKESQKA